MFHYTYLIQSIDSDMRYIGVRSSSIPPIEDTEYWGSSKHLPKDVATTHRKIILKIHPTREEAVAHEILLHTLNDVAANTNYYNKAKQTSVGFDTSGIPLSDSMKEKISNTLKNREFTQEHLDKIKAAITGRTFSEEHKSNLSKSIRRYTSRDDYVNPRKGVKVSAETRAKWRKAVDHIYSTPHKNPNFKPWFISYPTVTHLFYDKTKQEYAIEQGCSNKRVFQDLATKSKGIKPLSYGKYKGLIIGNIPTKGN